MKKLFYLFLIALVVVACKKDDDDDDNNNGGTPTPPTLEEQLVGTYVFMSATFNTPISIVENGDTVHYVAGDDASVYVADGMFASAPCSNADDAALNLRDNFTAFYVCQNEPGVEDQMGTWSVDEEENKLTLNLTNPAPFSIPIEDIDLTDNVLTGNIVALPVPIDAAYAVGAILPSGGFNIQMANVYQSFAKID